MDLVWSGEVKSGWKVKSGRVGEVWSGVTLVGWIRSGRGGQVWSGEIKFGRGEFGRGDSVRGRSSLVGVDSSLVEVNLVGVTLVGDGQFWSWWIQSGRGRWIWPM